MSVQAFAGEHEGRIGLGVGLLYRNGLDATISYERENANHNAWEFLPMVISSGRSVNLVATSARSRSGRITAHGELAQPTSLV